MLRSQDQRGLQFGKELVFIGEPGSCIGLLQVHNPRREAVKLRRLRLRLPEGLRGGCESAPGCIELRMLVTLCAEQSRSLRVRLPLDASTAPGSYKAKLELDDEKALPVQIHVLEQRVTRLSPQDLSCSATPGGRVQLRVAVENLGNVAVEIPARAALELHQAEQDWPDHFHAALKSHGDEGHDAFLNAFVKKMALAEPPLGRAKIVKGAGVLPAQHSRLLELELAVPKQLHGGRQYRACVRLADTLLHMTLYLVHETPRATG